jgi:RHS repeat-associated protein
VPPLHTQLSNAKSYSLLSAVGHTEQSSPDRNRVLWNSHFPPSAVKKNRQHFSADALNRAVLVGYNTVVNQGVASYESTTGYTYDAGNRMTQAVDTAGGTIIEAFDNLDRLTTETTPQGSISYGYDNAGRRTSMTVAGQPQVNYTYDNGNRLTQITQGTSSVGISYDNINRRTSLTLPNGVSVAYSFDNDSHITGITYNFGANTWGNLTYSYDALGRRTQVGGSFARTNLPGVITSASYDSANELTNWNGTAISYDLNGNMASDGTNAFTWNARNQVATLNSVSLQYDAFGRRIKNASGKSFLFDGLNSTQELSGTTPTASLWIGGVDEVFQRTDSSGTVAPLADALGSTIALADSAGNLTTTYSYDPYGNTTMAGASSVNPSQFTGRENEGNGLYYMRARYYSPLLGRFVAEDPLGFQAGGANLYAYVSGDPVDFSDPSGMCRVQVGHHTPYAALPNKVILIPTTGPVFHVDLPQHTYIVLSDFPLSGRYTKGVFTAAADKFPLPFSPAHLIAFTGVGSGALPLQDYTKDPLDTVTEDDGRSCDLDLLRLDNLANRITRAQLEYSTALGPNSNSATNAGLQALGINWTPTYLAPGWSQPLRLPR